MLFLMLFTVVFAPKISGASSELRLANRLRNRVISFVDAVSNAAYRRLLHPFQKLFFEISPKKLWRGGENAHGERFSFLYALFCPLFLGKKF